MTADPSERRIGALLHGLAILDLFSEENRVLGVSEISRTLGLHKSSVSRLATTLASTGYLLRLDDGRYRLGARLVDRAALVSTGEDLVSAATPFLSALAASSGETTHLAIRVGQETVTIAVAEGWHSVRMHAVIGKHSPLHCSALGKVLLAGLDDADIRELYRDTELVQRTSKTVTAVPALIDGLAEIRRKGYALDDEELERGLRCVAAPVLEREGVVAGLGISGPTLRMDRRRALSLALATKKAADELSVLLNPAASSASPSRGVGS